MDKKQKSSIEWQFEELFNSFEKFNNGEYTFDEYLKRNLEIREQAKEMEKERIENTYNSGYRNGNFSTCLTAKQYYKETFGGKND